MIKLGIIFGGRSREYKVSLMSATSVINAVDRDRYEVVMIGITEEGEWLLYDGPVDKIEDGSWQDIAKEALANDPEKYRLTNLKEHIDFALPILHGPYGEDGTIQGLFEMMDIPYGGCGVTSSALAMDKIFAKTIFGHAGLPQGPYVAVMLEELLHHQDEVVNKIEEEILYPVFVKPSNMGSSVGISKVYDRDELIKALKLASTYDRRIIVEQGIECREIEVAILGNDYPEASAVGEIIPAAEFYDYRSKYCDEGRTKLCIPADIPPKIAEEVRDIAIKAYTLLDCCGFARVDFFLEKETEKIYINEINTIPGFTRFSMFPLLWQHSGLVYPDLIERIVMLGYERYNVKNRR
ncbi:MAG: D-alanine--D-alanine ligase [Clostridiales bacterium]|nr:D-alanine--D-alanine ligase [Clostridiales bacterium]